LRISQLKKNWCTIFIQGFDWLKKEGFKYLDIYHSKKIKYKFTNELRLSSPTFFLRSKKFREIRKKIIWIHHHPPSFYSLVWLWVCVRPFVLHLDFLTIFLNFEIRLTHFAKFAIDLQFWSIGSVRIWSNMPKRSWQFLHGKLFK
jgi:hypothetical protein